MSVRKQDAGMERGAVRRERVQITGRRRTADEKGERLERNQKFKSGNLHYKYKVRFLRENSNITAPI
jgi:hypothetical protein